MAPGVPVNPPCVLFSPLSPPLCLPALHFSSVAGPSPPTAAVTSVRPCRAAGMPEPRLQPAPSAVHCPVMGLGPGEGRAEVSLSCGPRSPRGRLWARRCVRGGGRGCDAPSPASGAPLRLLRGVRASDARGLHLWPAAGPGVHLQLPSAPRCGRPPTLKGQKAGWHLGPVGAGARGALSQPAPCTLTLLWADSGLRRNW